MTMDNPLGEQPVFYLVLPEVLLLDLVGFAESLRIANNYGARFVAHFIGPQPRCLSSVGLGMDGIGGLPQSLPDNAIVIVSGVRDALKNIQSPAAQEVVAWLRRVHRPSHLVCTVCSGSFLAAQTGLFDAYQCTTHHELTAHLAQQHPHMRVLDNRVFVIDRNLMSSAGITAGVDLALHLISQCAGAVCAAHTARNMVVFLRRTPQDPQLSPWLAHRNHLHPLVHRAQDILTRDPVQPWTLPLLAQKVHASVRNLSRLFQEHAGTPVLDYLHKIRLERAKQLMQERSLSVERVAELAGFSSAHQLRRIWRKYERGTPGNFMSDA